MEEEKSKELQVRTSEDILNDETKDIVDRIVSSQDSQTITDLTKLFNINQIKKNVVRIDKLNALLDQVNDEAIERVSKRPDAISNRDLLDYMQVVQNSLDKSSKVVNSVDSVPIVQIHSQTNVFNVEDSNKITLDRDSRERVMEVVRQYMSRINAEKEDNITIIDVEDNTSKGEGEETND